MTLSDNRVVFKALVLVVVTFFAYTSTADAAVNWGATARGMGEAYVASASGLEGISYNPASGGIIEKGEVVSSVSRSSQNSVKVNYGTIGAGMRVRDYNHSLVVNRTSISHNFNNFDLTTEGLSLDYSKDVYYYNLATGSKSDHEFAINLKYFSVDSSLTGVTASGRGFDLGYLTKLSDRTRFGVAALNLAASRDWATGSEETIPREIRAGFNHEADFGWLVAGDVVHHEMDGLASVHLGMERWWILEETDFEFEYPVAFRFGLEKRLVGQKDANVSLGFSLRRNKGNFTYAYQQRSNFDNRHIFGYTTSFEPFVE
ncbi:MAG: hypothetical protein ABEK50_14280 [bacterium]